MLLRCATRSGVSAGFIWNPAADRVASMLLASSRCIAAQPPRRTVTMDKTPTRLAFSRMPWTSASVRGAESKRYPGGPSLTRSRRRASACGGVRAEQPDGEPGADDAPDREQRVQARRDVRRQPLDEREEQDVERGPERECDAQRTRPRSRLPQPPGVEDDHDPDQRRDHRGAEAVRELAE